MSLWLACPMPRHHLHRGRWRWRLAHFHTEKTSHLANGASSLRASFIERHRVPPAGLLSSVSSFAGHAPPFPTPQQGGDGRIKAEFIIIRCWGALANARRDSGWSASPVKCARNGHVNAVRNGCRFLACAQKQRSRPSSLLLGASKGRQPPSEQIEAKRNKQNNPACPWHVVLYHRRHTTKRNCESRKEKRGIASALPVNSVFLAPRRAFLLLTQRPAQPT